MDEFNEIFDHSWVAGFSKAQKTVPPKHFDEQSLV